jgi:hypothetical protein
MMTFDVIIMQISYDATILTITEETPGWEELISKTKMIFPSIPSNWVDESHGLPLQQIIFTL